MDNKKHQLGPSYRASSASLTTSREGNDGSCDGKSRPDRVTPPTPRTQSLASEAGSATNDKLGGIRRQQGIRCLAPGSHCHEVSTNRVIRLASHAGPSSHAEEAKGHWLLLLLLILCTNLGGRKGTTPDHAITSSSIIFLCPSKRGSFVPPSIITATSTSCLAAPAQEPNPSWPLNMPSCVHPP